MKKQVLVIHGGSAYSNYDLFLEYLRTIPLEWVLQKKKKRWTDTLAQLESESFEVFTPSMPNSQNAHYEEWKIWFERHFEVLDEDVVLIGWSLGGFFLLKYLSENSFPVSIKSLFLIGSPYTADGFEGDDCADFVFDTDLLGNIPKRVSNIHIFHSKDDFVVPFEHALKLKEALPTANMHTFEDRNHFLQEEFPELVEAILEGGL